MKVKEILLSESCGQFIKVSNISFVWLYVFVQGMEVASNLPQRWINPTLRAEPLLLQETGGPPKGRGSAHGVNEPFTLKSDQFQISHLQSHQKYYIT